MRWSQALGEARLCLHTQSPRELMEPAEPTPRFQAPEVEGGQVVLRSGQTRQAGSRLVVRHSLKEVTEAQVLPGPHMEESSNCFPSS